MAPPAAGPSHLGRLASHGAIYTAGTVLTRLFAFAMVPVYTRLLSPADYGLLDLVDTADLVVVVIFSQAITDSVLRFLHEARDPPERAAVVASAILGLAALGTVLAATGWAFATPLAAVILRHGGHAILLRLTFAAVVFQGVLEVPLAVLRGTGRPVAFVAATVTRVALGLGLNIAFLVGLRLGVRGMVLSSLLSSGVVATVMVAHALRRTGLRFSPKVLATMLRFGWPLVPGALAQIVLQHSRAYVLARYCSMATVGVWALGFRLGVTVTLIAGQPLRNAWGAQMYAVWASPAGPVAYRRAGTLITFGLVWAATILAVFAHTVVHLMAPPAYADARQVAPAVAFAFALRELGDYFRGGLLVGGNPRAIAWIEPALVPVDVGLGVLLVACFGLRGAVAATPVVFGLYALAMHAAARRVLPVRYEYGRMALCFALGLGVSAAGVALHTGRTSLDLGVGALLVGLYPVAALALVFRAPEERSALHTLRRRVLGR